MYLILTVTRSAIRKHYKKGGVPNRLVGTVYIFVNELLSRRLGTTPRHKINAHFKSVMQKEEKPRSFSLAFCRVEKLAK
jgi:hypothetical protein